MTTVRVRGALPAEAAILAELANDLNDHVGIRGRPFTPERVLADGFGPEAAFTPLVAELGGAVVGYAFFSAGYNTGVAVRSIVLHDLFVMPAARGRGAGYALIAAVAGKAVRAGCVTLAGGVHTANAGALACYRTLGAVAAERRVRTARGERGRCPA